MPQILYPSFSQPFINPAAPTAAPQGDGCSYPASTSRPARQQPASEIQPRPPAPVQLGGTCLYPDVARRAVRAQPQGEVLSSGQFAATNTKLGGVCTYPDVTRRLVPQQPQGEILTPGQFATANTTFGGSCVYPFATWRPVPLQPPSATLPPGAFTTVAAVVHPVWFSIYPDRTQPSRPDRFQFPDGFTAPYSIFVNKVDRTYVNRVVGKGIDERLRRHTEVVASIFNSLIRQGVLVQTGPQEWELRLP